MFLFQKEKKYIDNLTACKKRTVCKYDLKIWLNSALRTAHCFIFFTDKVFLNKTSKKEVKLRLYISKIKDHSCVAMKHHSS